MSVGSHLRTYLLTISDIEALVSTKIFPQRWPEGVAFPCIVYQETGGERVRSLSGSSGLAQTSFQLDCMAVAGEGGYDTAKAIADALRNCLECYQGPMGDLHVQGVFCQPDSDSIAQPTAGHEDAVQSVTVNIGLWYTEAIPANV